jgi:hypothetical protein
MIRDSIGAMLLGLMMTTPAWGDVVLAEGGRSRYVIVLPGDASPSEVHAVRSCLGNYSVAQNRANLELWSPEQQLQTGESIIVTQTYRIVEDAAGLVREWRFMQ